MSSIFLSYRREDGAGWTGRLAVELQRAFPNRSVFQDISAIDIGEDFVEAMRRYLSTCAVTLVVIGPRWSKAADEEGRRRLEDPEDWVRLEIVESLQRSGLRVVPVLVGSASMPKAAELPEPLRPLARRNAHEITDKRWDYDVSQLVAALKKIPGLAGASGPSQPIMAEPNADVQGIAPVGATAPSPGDVFRDAPEAPEMVVIPAGRYLMGSPATEKGRSADEGPQHEVCIAKPFAVGRFEVTFDEWDACVAAGGCKHGPEDSGWGRGKRPVINVSWDDAQAYVAWLSKETGERYRLLSEAEWEYAARAGTTTRYPWGNDAGSNRANFDGSGSQWSSKQTAPVGSFEPNGFGLHDMIGNVWEWVQDCWNENYAGAPADGSAWEAGDCGWRVARGGSWNRRPGLARAAYRVRDPPSGRDYGLGFRVARTL